MQRNIDLTRRKKSPEKAAKTLLHQSYGAFLSPNFHKRMWMLFDTLLCEHHCQAHTAQELMRLHASTRERLEYISEFYCFVFSITAPVRKVLDLGCGLNPLWMSLMPELCSSIVEYCAVDIDIAICDALNGYFAYMGLPPLAIAMDLATEVPTSSTDLTLMLKLLPVLDRGFEGCDFFPAKDLQTRYLIVSYPLKSLCGRQKGMGRTYRAAFEAAHQRGELGRMQLLAERVYGDELFYVLESCRQS